MRTRTYYLVDGQEIFAVADIPDSEFPAKQKEADELSGGNFWWVPKLRPKSNRTITYLNKCPECNFGEIQECCHTPLDIHCSRYSLGCFWTQSFAEYVLANPSAVIFSPCPNCSEPLYDDGDCVSCDYSSQLVGGANAE